MNASLKIIYLLFSLAIINFQFTNSAICTRQRCCLVSPCTSSYCIQKNSQSWISTQNFANYQYTKLVLANNSCIPCSYNCKSCNSQTSCSTCANGFYMNSTSSSCLLCGDRCISCSVVNQIKKCSSCSSGTYLESITLTCKSCPLGSSSCSSPTSIISCMNGYKKSSNSLYCTSCPSNCMSCPISDTVCASCFAGYYVTNGLCSLCNLVNCNACLKVGSIVQCTTCNNGYRLSSGACLACSANCNTCMTTASCTQCAAGYFLQGGACSKATSAVLNCQIYSTTNACSSCISGYYLKNSQCYPCSLLCSTCNGNHFGSCMSCNSNANLFNQMCLITNFPLTSIYNLYLAFPYAMSFLSSGSQGCTKLFASGKSVSINLNNLQGYKIEVSWKIYSQGGSTIYDIQLTNIGITTPQTFTTLGTQSYLMCDNNMSLLYYMDIQNKKTFSPVKISNTLTFSTNNNMILDLQQVIVTVYRCNNLCIQCQQTLCSQCLMTMLYTQDAYCVYTCSNGYYIYKNPLNILNPNQCLSTCPLGTYTLSSNVTCMSCISPCLTCMNEYFCLSCIQSYYLTNSNTCNTTCPYKFYGKVETKTCQNCVGRCLTCLDEERCLSCAQGFLFNGTMGCVDDCGKGVTALDGLYADLLTLFCMACDVNCLNCQFQATTCTKCAATKFYFQNTCLVACPIRYFAPTLSNICQNCDYPCKACQTSSLTCTSCLEGYLYQSGCVTDCVSGYYEDNVNLVCIACDSKCSQCYGTSAYCLSCKTSYYYYQYTCYAICPDQFYAQVSSGICASCVNLCNNCLNQTYCLTCKSNFLYQGQCLGSGNCPSGYYADITTLACNKCSNPCLQCQYNSTYCTKCNISNPLGLIFLQSNTCVTSCASNYYFPLKNSTSATCSPCQQPCLTCKSASLCLSCIPGYKYSKNICSSTCSFGTYFDSTVDDCLICSASCSVCSNANFCQICNNLYFINSISTTSNACVNTCPSTYYAEKLSSSCQKCIYPCNTCSSSIACLTCLTGVLYISSCISSCPDSTYLNIGSNECMSCTSPCLTCTSNPIFCKSCIDTYFLYYQNHTCLLACPSGLYTEQLTKSCIACPSTCLTCTNSTFCLTCIPGKTYKYSGSNVCLQYCPISYFNNDTTSNCDHCQAKCLTCKGAKGNCLSCNVGYLLTKIDFGVNDCLTFCPNGYYAQGNYCYACSFPCLSCSSPTKCISCVTGTFLHKNSSSCLLACPSSTCYDFTSLSCQSCISPCQSCSSPAYCLSCKSTSNLSTYLLDGSCLTSCPSQYYPDDSGICNRCYGLCNTCSSKYQCLTCLAGYAYDGFCYSNCPARTYANMNTTKCEQCDVKCQECALTADYCVKCPGGFFVYKGICSATCPNGTYEDNGQCLACTFPCVSCNNLNTCNQCLGGYLLYMNIECINDVAKCPNDFYKMDAIACVPVTWCPTNYFIDQTQKTCSASCDRTKYTQILTKMCQDSCNEGEYAGVNMICQSWITNPPISLMGISAITYISSSYLYISMIFNESQSWSDISAQMYSISLYTSRLLFTSLTMPQYTLSLASPSLLTLKISSYPSRIAINLPAYRIHSSLTKYPLQNPSFNVDLPTFTPYSNGQIFSGMIMGEFSQGICWFIMLLSVFFLFKNRLSDLYVLWDNVQLLYLLLFLDIQYPPNLNQFFNGLKFTHFTFLPSIFTASTTRKISDSPFYAYSYDNSFLRNTGGIFFALILVFGLLLLLKLGQVLIKKVQVIRQKSKQYPYIKQFIYKGVLRYRWHHTSDILFLTYPFITLFSLAQLKHISSNPSNMFSNILSILSFVLYLVWILFVGYKLNKHFRNISKGKLVGNLKCFYRGIRKEEKFGVALVLLRYARKFLYSLVIAVFSTNPMYALPILMFTSVLMAMFLFLNLPYKKKLSNFITIAAEIILVLMYILLALINFNDQTFDPSTKHFLGWICCLLLAIMIFGLIYEVFCKTMFYLEPQSQVAPVLDPTKLNDKQYLRKKAQQFFDSLLPRLRQRLNFDQQDSDDQMYKYSNGDSQNSENNDQRQKDWDQQDSEEFKHYDNSQSQGGQTDMKTKKDIKRAPEYLVRCVKDIQ